MCGRQRGNAKEAAASATRGQACTSKQDRDLRLVAELLSARTVTMGRSPSHLDGGAPLTLADMPKLVQVLTRQMHAAVNEGETRPGRRGTWHVPEDDVELSGKDDGLSVVGATEGEQKDSESTRRVELLELATIGFTTDESGETVV